MTDSHALPDGHVLKPLELRLLDMADEAGPLKVYAGNAVAALRVFAAQHPGLADSCDRAPLTDAAGNLRDSSATLNSDGPSSRLPEYSAVFVSPLATDFFSSAFDIEHANPSPDVAHCVTIGEQLDRLLEPGRMDAALDSLADDLDDDTYRDRIKAMAVKGLLAGHAVYRDKSCHLTTDEIQYEKDCEVRDAVVYECIGGMALE